MLSGKFPFRVTYPPSPSYEERPTDVHANMHNTITISNEFHSFVWVVSFRVLAAGTWKTLSYIIVPPRLEHSSDDGGCDIGKSQHNTLCRWKYCSASSVVFVSLSMVPIQSSVRDYISQDIETVIRRLSTSISFTWFTPGKNKINVFCFLRSIFMKETVECKHMILYIRAELWSMYSTIECHLSFAFCFGNRFGGRWQI